MLSMKTKDYLLIFLLSITLCCGGCSWKWANLERKSEIVTLTDSVQTENSGTDSQDMSKNKDEYFVNEEEITEDETVIEKEIEMLLETMTLEEKVAQLFIILPEALMDGVKDVTAAGDMTKNAIDEIPVGGFVYLSNNLESKEQVQTMLNNVQSYSMERLGLPAFLCIDEEGGSVTRVSGTGKFDVPEIPDMYLIGQTQDLDKAYQTGKDMGKYLFELGFNVDFAPVADVLTNSDNKVVKLRSFGSEPEVVSDMSQAVIRGLEEEGVYGTYKHFPGHGATAGDTHEGYAYTEKTLEELKECELIPFQDGIDKGVSFIMVGHISLPNIGNC